jgi:hypothetical protein
VSDTDTTITPERESLPGIQSLTTPALAKTYTWLRDLEEAKRRSHRNSPSRWRGDSDAIDFLGRIGEVIYAELADRDRGFRS